MSRKHVIAVLKLVLVAGLMTWVFATIQWRDSYTTLDADGEVVGVVRGKIDGPWDGESVWFWPAGDQASAVEIRPGEQSDGTDVAVAPGLLTYVRNLDWLLFALGAVCYVISLTVAAARWWWLLRVNDLNVSMLEAQRLTWIGVFFNNVVPGQTGGDLVKALYVMKRCPGSRVRALLSVIVDRILGLGSLAMLGAVVVLFYLDRFAALALGIWAVVLGVCLLGVVAFSRRIRRLVRLDALLHKLPTRLSQLLMRVDEAVFFYRRHKRGVMVWLLGGIGNHVVAMASFALMGSALGVGIPVMEYFVLIPIILMGSAVPIAPNGWGVGEALFRHLFGVYGAVHLPAGMPNPQEVMGTRGVALSVVYRIHTTLWSLLGGLMLLFDKDRVTRSDLDAEVAREVAEARGEEVAAG